MTRKTVVRGEGTTRQSILAAATQRFASAPYDNVRLRDLAADVGVDVAYVHRSFGSKENLFRAVLETRCKNTSLSEVGMEGLALHLARRVIERQPSCDPQQPDPSRIFIQSLASLTGGPLVGERLQADTLEPLRDKLGDPSAHRALMMLSLLMGFGMLRNLLRLPAATAIEPAEAERLIAEAMECMMRGDAGGDATGCASA